MVPMRRKKVTEQQSLLVDPAPRDIDPRLAALFNAPARAPRGGRMHGFDAVLHDAERRAQEGTWDEARAPVLVGLYGVCHRLVYNVLPDELYDMGAFRGATRAATRMVHEQFEDGIEDAVQFVKWSWKREQSRAAWARSKSISRNRMSWHAQFSTGYVTDWRVEMSKATGM